MSYVGHITCDPHILLGKPTIKGTRISVELVLKKLAEGMTIDGVLEAYPRLTRKDIMAVLF